MCVNKAELENESGIYLLCGLLNLKILSDRSSRSLLLISLKMDRLPVECLTIILQNLDLNDLLTCRRLNQRFRFAANDVRFKELTVYERDLECETFFLTRKSNFSCRLFRTGNQKFLKSPLIWAIVSKLSLMYIDYHLNTNDLNELTNLRRLQIEHLELGEDSVLNLPKLQVLCIEDLYEKRLRLDCPSLTAFKNNYGLSTIQFVYPGKLTQLGIWSCEISLRPFESLEYLYIKNGSNIDDSVLDLLPKLRQIHAFSGLSRDKIARFLRRKAALGRVDFQLFNSGILFDCAQRLDELNLDVKLDTSVLIGCYDKLADKLPWIRNFPFSNEQLISLLDNVPERFFTKFYNLKAIVVCGAVNQANFRCFLKHFPNLTYLNLENSSLRQSFYDRLIELVPRLLYLEILNESEKKIDDLQFLFNFRLRFLTLDQQPPFGVVNHLCRSRPEFVLNLIIGKGVFNLSSSGSNTRLTGEESVAQFEDLDQAVKFVRNIFSVLG